MTGSKQRSPNAATVRAEFLTFFQEKAHEIVPSASMVPRNDPSLLFTNAGMNQFKDVFLGAGTRAYLRAADSQKCLRVSGKHNDLEEVGHDTYHHTFFEMLGNWSFGDYFKDEAIAWAWELLTEHWRLDPTRLYATVHEGDESLNLGPDDEAAAFWRRYLPEKHVLYCDTKDNFWRMGDTGPCGPCSEIHVDLRTDAERNLIPGEHLVNKGDPRVIELWNLVFIQFNAVSEGELETLAAKHVDTGMGLERLVAVLQGVSSTYDTDLFAPLMERIAVLTPNEAVRGYDDITDAENRAKIRVAMRVVADHIRAIAFAIADGVVPGNVGRAYVIRRILRRASRYGYTILGIREPFLYKLVEPLTTLMGEHFNELVENQARIEQNIRGEEASFLQTLGNGIALFECIVPFVGAVGKEGTLVKDRLAADRGAMDLLQKAYPEHEDVVARTEQFAEEAVHGIVPGAIAFLLHDTYGFPLDLTQLMAREKGLEVDLDGYAALMAAQKERARQDLRLRGKAGNSTASHDGKGWQTVTIGRDSEFIGYDTLEASGLTVRALHVEEPNMVVLDATPFYAERGGQVGDTGLLRLGGENIRVLDTRIVDDRVCHLVERLPQRADTAVYGAVDRVRRKNISKHHTATHLLHAALREVVGPSVTQKGSLVAPDHLRFDFNHFERLSETEKRRVQEIVNEAIQRNIPAEIEDNVPIEQAIERGAAALFGEKYGDHVRVVTFDESFSIELCGGTHVEATGEIGLLLLRSEGSIAAGVRRIDAITGLDAVALVQQERAELARARGQFKGQPDSLDVSIAALQGEHKALQKEIKRLQEERLAASLHGFIQSAKRVGPWRVAVGRIPNTGMGTLRGLGKQLREQLGAGSIGVLGAADPEGGKAYLVVTASDDLVTAGIKAGAIVAQLARRVGGGGGGRPQFATAGGRKPEELDRALGAAHNLVARVLTARA